MEIKKLFTILCLSAFTYCLSADYFKDLLDDQIYTNIDKKKKIKIGTKG